LVEQVFNLFSAHFVEQAFQPVLPGKAVLNLLNRHTSGQAAGLTLTLLRHGGLSVSPIKGEG
jgi:hypothetical protein